MTFLISLVALLLTIAFPFSALAQPRPPIRVGLLLPSTGPLTVQGTDTTRGAELYFSKVGNRAGGREIQLLKEDTEAKADVGLTKVKKLVERDRRGPGHSGLHPPAGGPDDRPGGLQP